MGAGVFPARVLDSPRSKAGDQAYGQGGNTKGGVAEVKYLLSIDPGKSSGAAVLEYTPASVSLVEAYQVVPGVSAFRRLLDTLQATWGHLDPTWISEKFSPRPGQGFTHGLDSTIPLVCEGVLIDRDLLPEYATGEKRWRSPSLMYLVGGDGLADRRKRMHRFLKESGFYVTGKQFGSPDADDARSAIAHGLSYLARELRHEPSFRLMTEWTERN